MIFRDILFKIPKKYLVVVIVLLTMFVLKNNVLGYSNGDTIDVQDPVIDLVYYKHAYFNDNTPIDTHVVAPYLNGNDFNNKYRFDLKFQFKDLSNYGLIYLFYNRLNNEIQLDYDPRDKIMWFSYANQYTSLFTSTLTTGVDYRIFLSLYPNYEETNSLLPYFNFYTGDELSFSGTLNMGTTNFNTDNSQTIKVGHSRYFLENFKIYIYDTDYQVWNLAFNCYPVKYLDSNNGVLTYLPGYYDTVSNNFTYYTNLVFNDNDILSSPPEDILSSEPEEPEEPEEPTTPDYTQNFEDINNSINETNNFLQNDYIDNSVVDINAPNVSNSQISNISDGGFSSIFSIFTNALDNNNEQSIDIYIPNYITGGGTKFLTIHSNLVRNAISNTAVIPGTNFTILNLVELIWTALFGYWFIVIITGFVNIIYSGSIISDRSLQKLSSTYTGVTGSML